MVRNAMGSNNPKAWILAMKTSILVIISLISLTRKYNV